MIFSTPWLLCPGSRHSTRSCQIIRGSLCLLLSVTMLTSLFPFLWPLAVDMLSKPSAFMTRGARVRWAGLIVRPLPSPSGLCGPNLPGYGLPHDSPAVARLARDHQVSSDQVAALIRFGQPRTKGRSEFLRKPAVELSWLYLESAKACKDVYVFSNVVAHEIHIMSAVRYLSLTSVRYLSLTSVIDIVPHNNSRYCSAVGIKCEYTTVTHAPLTYICTSARLLYIHSSHITKRPRLT